MNYKKLLLITFFFVLKCTYVYAQQWTYTDPLKPFDSFSIQNEPNAFGINDVIFDAIICGNKSQYICIETAGFSFHVPKNLLSSMKSWVVNENHYKSHFYKQLQIFGLQDKIFLIDKKEGNKTIRFLFSKKRGLIGMGGFSEKYSSMFLVNSYCGFGAPEKCNESAR